MLCVQSIMFEVNTYINAVKEFCSQNSLVCIQWHFEDPLDNCVSMFRDSSDILTTNKHDLSLVFCRCEIDEAVAPVPN